MKRAALFLGLGLVSSALAGEPPVSPGEIPGPGRWRFEELRRFPAPEARQGVASDGEFLYVIANHAIGKYRAATGERVAGWEGPESGPIMHLNAGIVRAGKLSAPTRIIPRCRC